MKDISSIDMQVFPKKDLEEWSHRIHSCPHCGHHTSNTVYSHKSLKMSLNLSWHHLKSQI